MAFGLENKKVALVGLNSQLSDAYISYLQGQGISNISVYPGIVNVETLLESDALIAHLTHNEEDINSWTENLLLAHQAGLYMLVMQIDMYETDVQPRITLQKAGVRLRKTNTYRSSFHELVDHLKMSDLESNW